MHVFYLFSCTTDKAVASAGKESLPCSSTEMLQPAPVNSSISLPHCWQPLHSKENVLIEVSTVTNTRKRSSKSFSHNSLRTLEQGTPASTRPADVSSGQVASGQHGTGKLSAWPVDGRTVCSCV